MNIGSSVVTTAVTVIVEMNLLELESHKYLFCDVNLCFCCCWIFFLFIKGHLFVKHVCPFVLLLTPFPIPFSEFEVVCPEKKKHTLLRNLRCNPRLGKSISSNK